MAVNRRIFFLATAILGIALVLAAVMFSREKETMASRSAAAFREALRKGEPIGASAHGGHGGSPTTKSEMSGHEMSPPGASGSEKAMPGMAGMQHGTTGTQPGTTGTQPGMTGMQHGTTGTQPGMTGMQHGTTGMKPGMTGMTGMQHGTTGAQPGMAGMPMAGGAAGIALPKAAEASPGQPARTLRPDPLDEAAETSVVDATRSLEMAREMGGMEGMQHGMTSYRQLDAGRGSVTMPEGESGPPGSSVTPKAPASAPHQGMQHGSPQPSPTQVPRRTPPPSEKKPGTPPTAPTHPPHHHPGGSNDGDGSGRSGDPR